MSFPCLFVYFIFTSNSLPTVSRGNVLPCPDRGGLGGPRDDTSVGRVGVDIGGKTVNLIRGRTGRQLINDELLRRDFLRQIKTDKTLKTLTDLR